MLRSIVKQIALQNEDALGDLETFYVERKALQIDTSENPFAAASDADIIDLLRKLLQRFKSSMMIIDALDEIESNRADTIRILRDFYAADGTVKLLFTSRSQQDIKELMKDWEPIQISAQSSDVTRYVAFQISHRISKDELRVTDESLKQHIMKQLVEKADGM